MMNILSKTTRLMAAVMCVALLFGFGGCVSSRHVPPGGYLLDKVSVSVCDSNRGDISEQEMLTYLRQQPNHKMFWSMKFRLGIYNMSGSDTTKWWNRWVRKLGEPPVVFDSALTEASVMQLRKALDNKGYLHARVEADTVFDTVKRKARVDYRLYPGDPYRVRSVDYSFSNDTIRDLVMADSDRFVVRAGDPLDRSLLESQREIITDRLRNSGYFAFTKEFITFNADTTAGGHEEILQTFERERVPILLGTQMVAKGLDFENVTLVGVLSADISLYVDNYRAAERTFSLLTQVVGRAGRGGKTGRAVIQTYTPGNDVIRCAARQDYDAFYESEIRMRRLRRYPPFADLFTVPVLAIENSAVFQKISHNGTHRNIFADTLHANLQAADSPDNQINPDSRSRSLIKRRNNIPVAERIHFCNNMCRSARLCILFFPANEIQETIL